MQQKTLQNDTDRTSLLAALAAGQTPPHIAPYIQVGRKSELVALKGDIDRVRANGSCCRLLTGPVGCGKTQLLNTVAEIAIASGVPVMRATITRSVRLHGPQGEAQNLLVELLSSMKIREAAPGMGLESLLGQLWQKVFEAQGKVRSEKALTNAVRAYCKPLTALNLGASVIEVLVAYFRAKHTGNDEMVDKAIAWMRGQIESVAEARQSLGVGMVLCGADLFNYLKLLGLLSRLAGFGGVLVILDEMGALSQLPQKSLRHNNYEIIHTILDDCHQGRAPGLGLLMAGTPDFLEHKDRGLYWYEALYTRLCEATAAAGVVYTGGPVIKLQRLSNEEFMVLLTRVRNLLLGDGAARDRLPDEALCAVLECSLKKLGAEEFLDPRVLLRQLARLVQLVEEYPDQGWKSLLGLADKAAGAGEKPVSTSIAPHANDRVSQFAHLTL